MIEKTDISEIVDGDEEITLIELSQNQYDAYKSEAEALGVNTHEYIELALKHEQMALNKETEPLPESIEKETPQTTLNDHIKRFLS